VRVVEVTVERAIWYQDVLATLFLSFGNNLLKLVIVTLGELLVKVILELVALLIVFQLLRNLKVMLEAQLVCLENHRSIQILGSLYHQN